MPNTKLNTAGLKALKEKICLFIDEKWNGLFRVNLLRVTFFSGLILIAFIFGVLVFVNLSGSGRTAPVLGEEGTGFFRSIREWDRLAEKILKQASPALLKEAEELDRALDKIEKNAGGLHELLSVLKRRRRLASLNPRFARSYRESARRARKAYPYSEPAAAVAASALLFDSAVTAETGQEIRGCLPLIADPRFDPLRLSIHALLGDFKNAKTALAALPPDFRTQGSAALWRSTFSAAAETEAIAADLAIVKLLKGDTTGAAAEINGVLSGYSAAPGVFSLPVPSGEFIRFAAEYSYDFGDILRSAELFAGLRDDAALSRQADALWLGGYADSARNIWRLLSAPPADGLPGAFRQRSLYNLAASAQTQEEAASLLEQLAALPAGSGAALGEIQSAANSAGASSAYDPSRQYGLIRYSRFFNAPRALAILESGAQPGVPPSINALLDLEMLKRRTEIGEAGRLTAETWLLLGRYSGEENLYRWAAWYFDLQRNYTETAKLLKNAARHGFSGQWLSIHEGSLLIREGSLDSAEKVLSAVSADASGWPAAANLGRLLEARHSPARAITAYETAAAYVKNREAASNIQFRIAHCLKTLGRAGEARRVLEYALDLNPANLSARLELDRLR